MEKKDIKIFTKGYKQALKDMEFLIGIPLKKLVHKELVDKYVVKLEKELGSSWKEKLFYV